MDKLADDIACLVKALGHESCILVAHDWGGVVSWLVAHTHSSLIDKLVIMSAPHPKCTYDWDQYKRYVLDSHTIALTQNMVAPSSAITCCCCCMYSIASHALLEVSGCGRCATLVMLRHADELPTCLTANDKNHPGPCLPDGACAPQTTEQCNSALSCAEQECRWLLLLRVIALVRNWRPSQTH